MPDRLMEVAAWGRDEQPREREMSTPYERELGFRLLDELNVGESIPSERVAVGDGGGFYPCGTPECLITPENEVLFERGDCIQRFSSVRQLEALVKWGSPFMRFDIQRTGDRTYKMLNYESCAPKPRSAWERFNAGDWFGY